MGRLFSNISGRGLRKLMVIYGVVTTFCVLSVGLHIKPIIIFEEVYNEKYIYLNIMMGIYLL